MHAPVAAACGRSARREMHDADVTKGRCSRIDSPPRSYYADVIWPANTHYQRFYSPSDCRSSSVRAFPFFSPVNPVLCCGVRSSSSSSSINTELIPEMSIVLCGCVRPTRSLLLSRRAPLFSASPCLVRSPSPPIFRINLNPPARDPQDNAHHVKSTNDAHLSARAGMNLR